MCVPQNKLFYSKSKIQDDELNMMKKIYCFIKNSIISLQLEHARRHRITMGIQCN